MRLDTGQMTEYNQRVMLVEEDKCFIIFEQHLNFFFFGVMTKSSSEKTSLSSSLYNNCTSFSSLLLFLSITYLNFIIA